MTKDRTQRDIPPAPPFKGGKSAAKGGCYPFKGGRVEAKEDVTPSKGKCRGLTAVRALKGRVNSAQCMALGNRRTQRRSSMGLGR